ncbi:MAG: hypothetical protein LBH56_05625 [Coriobacteriales bacterium]|jgi:hypothetical protein|nr:hypothetical protein [Coriobacteriales bacterium]
MKKHASSALLVLASLVIALGLALGLPGCDNNSEETLIRDGLTKRLEQFKDTILATWGNSPEGIAPEALNAWLDSYTFTIDEIVIDGNLATTRVRITSKQLYPVIQGTEARIAAGEVNMSQTDEYQARVTEIILDELRNASPVTTEILITCEKTGTTWIISDASDEECTDALLGPAPNSTGTTGGGQTTG